MKPQILAAAIMLAGCISDGADQPVVTKDIVRTIETVICRPPDPRMGRQWNLALQDDGRARFALEGVVIAGKTDPHAMYTYADDGKIVRLTPDDSDSRELGPMRYSRNPAKLYHRTGKPKQNVPCHSASQVSTAKVVSRYQCAPPDPRLGDHVLLTLFDNDQATATYVASGRNPQYAFTWMDGGLDIFLEPDGHGTWRTAMRMDKASLRLRKVTGDKQVQCQALAP